MTKNNKFGSSAQHDVCDVIIIGGAIMGSSTAWFLSKSSDFNGRVLVIERDPNYEFCSTAHTNSCMRQQFSTKLNVQISQFAAHFVKNLRDYMGDDRVPELTIQNYGYLYLADTPEFAQILRENQKVQIEAGAETQLLDAAEINRRCIYGEATKFVDEDAQPVVDGEFRRQAVR